MWTDDAEDLARYVRPDELHQSFNFAWLEAPWSATAFRKVIDDTLAAVPYATWVLSNHDVVRHRTRYGTDDPGAGLARARAALLTMLALPGSAYLYQGEELGLPEVTDLPDDARQDPIFFRSKGELPGRDGCRVPIPWTVDPPSHGFSPGGVEPWLPQPESFAELSVEKQEGVADSTLECYRRALALRRALAGEIPYTLEWLDSPEGVLFLHQGSADLRTQLRHGPRPSARAHRGAADERPAQARPAAAGHGGVAAPRVMSGRRAAG
ncbi:hypothetical protein GCM10020001_021520 [Nonomuraea salmonea]